jgi:predicted metalloprotease with PDZ domain
MNKKILLGLSLTFLIFGCKSGSNPASSTNLSEVAVTINLNDVIDDKVMVTVKAPTITTNEIEYNIPKIIPGTYSVDDYGKLLEDFKAFDKNGNVLATSKKDVNTWVITNAKKLDKITYLVNDTYDVEGGGGFGSGIFSPAGTNIDAGTNFMLNNHGFIGYFTEKKDLTYKLTVEHPETLYGATSLTDDNPSKTVDLFVTSRYNELVDNPIMYSKPDINSFIVDGMEILFSVYSANGKHNAKSLSGDLEKTMRAQKKFLGPINDNKKYTVLLYLSDMKKKDAKGFGALEHNTSTVVVFPEMMSTAALGEQIKDVVSHEFFHIVTPLSVHSNEIHFFDFNSPKMSKHLWMYEGVTEYFANLFQINQDLIDESDFYQRMSSKIKNAKRMNDKMPFTKMSANVLEKPYKDQYLNVYDKGALIAMCMDIIIREKSNGERGILDLMQKLSIEFGPKKPFSDDLLFDKIVALTYPEVGTFLNTYVDGETPIPYEDYFAKMGITYSKIKKTGNPFMNGSNACITGIPSTKEITIRSNTELTNFLLNIGIKADDIIVAINDKAYNLDNISEMMESVQSWEEGTTISLKIKRNDKEQILTGKAILPVVETQGYTLTDVTKKSLKQAWLKG